MVHVVLSRNSRRTHTINRLQFDFLSRVLVSGISRFVTTNCFIMISVDMLRVVNSSPKTILIGLNSLWKLSIGVIFLRITEYIPTITLTIIFSFRFRLFYRRHTCHRRTTLINIFFMTFLQMLFFRFAGLLTFSILHGRKTLLI